MPRRTDRIVEHSNGTYSRIYEAHNGNKFINVNGDRQPVRSTAGCPVKVTSSMTQATPGEYYMGRRGIVEFDDRASTSGGPAYYAKR